MEDNDHQPIQVLLVDDDEDDQDLFLDALKEINANVHCTTASDGVQAIKILKGIAAPPDMIFLDLNMPVMDGRECLKEIRKMNRFKNVPIIIQTTSKDRIDIKESYEAGADYFLPKSSSFKAMCKDIQYILSMKWYTKRHTI